MIVLLALAAVATPVVQRHADAIAAAERSFARRAQAEGQWKAFRATSLPDAIMFVPEVKRVGPVLATAPEPAVPVMWWPGTIVPSCDGSLGVSTGPWVRAASAGMGTFTTVWRNTSQGYRWHLDHGRPTPKLVAAGDAPSVVAPVCDTAPGPEGAAARAAAYERLAASVAAAAGTQGAAAFARDAAPDVVVQAENAMPASGAAALPPTKFGVALASGHADDWTLAWASRALIGGAVGAHDLRVWQWRGKDGWKLVLYETIGVT